MTTSLIFADISRYQGDPDWATYGLHTPAVMVNCAAANTLRNAQVAGARAHCAFRGWYVYLTAQEDPATVARELKRFIGPLRRGEVWVLDLESGYGDQSPRANAFFAALADPHHWLYSYTAFVAEHLPGERVQWAAQYSSQEPTIPHVVWQYTDRHVFPGIAGACDGNIYHGTVEQLIETVWGAPVPPAPMFHLVPTMSIWDLNTGTHVVNLQRGLNRLDGAGLATDGIFGRHTAAAVEEYQRRHRLVQDGIVGPITQRALFAQKVVL